MPPMSLPVYSLPEGSEGFSSGAEVPVVAVIFPSDEVPGEVAAEETADTGGSGSAEVGSGVPAAVPGAEVSGAVSVSGVPGTESPGTALAGAVFTGED